MSTHNEYPHRRDSDEYPQHMFLWKTIKNYPLIITKNPLYLFHCDDDDDGDDDDYDGFFFFGDYDDDKVFICPLNSISIISG